MRKNLTEIVFILDRSGSMSGLEADTIGGYNSLLEKQKKEEGEAIVSTVLFDDTQEVLHDRVDLDKMKPITDKEYYVRGCTALLDAIEVDGRFGIGADRAVNYECDAVGTAVNYKVLSKAVSQVRASAVCPSMALSEDWKEEIEADYKMRHRR